MGQMLWSRWSATARPSSAQPSSHTLTQALWLSANCICATQVTVYARGLGVVRSVVHDSHASGVSSIIRFWSSSGHLDPFSTYPSQGDTSVCTTAKVLTCLNRQCKSLEKQGHRPRELSRVRTLIMTPTAQRSSLLLFQNHRVEPAELGRLPLQSSEAQRTDLRHRGNAWAWTFGDGLLQSLDRTFRQTWLMWP